MHDPSIQQAGVLVLGNFDGVHRGHQALVELAGKIAAKADDRPVGILSFTPHPRRFFVPDSAPDRLCNDVQKREWLKAAGADFVSLEPFDADIAAMSPETFVRDLLVKTYAPHTVIVGYNFRFGQGRAGSAETLKELGQTYGFQVHIAEAVTADGSVISSSRIRALISAGDLDAAAELLGRPFTISGPVVHGDKRGREIGYPTANQTLNAYLRPPYGIYAVRVQTADKHWHNGVANLGVRPMFAVETPLLETFIFDFDGMIYDQRLDVALIARLRDEKKFASIEALVIQMDKDSQTARRLLEK
tara:strand:- start:795 stop:1703 length:909 start_codon:yes stop_codon:yes gene_type:complete